MSEPILEPTPEPPPGSVNEPQSGQGLTLSSSTTVVALAATRFSIPLAQIGRYVAGSRYQLNSRSEALARQALTRVRESARPRFGYKRVGIVGGPDPEPDRIELASGYCLTLPEGERGPGLQGVVAVVCTLGEDLDRQIRRLNRDGDLTGALFLDGAGVALLEALGRTCRTHIKAAAKSLGLFCGAPFGPGYGATPLEELRDLFRHIEGATLGVRLSGTAMMEPLKSVAFWLRLTTHGEGIQSDVYKCRRCAMESCLYRKASYEQDGHTRTERPERCAGGRPE